MSSVFHRKAHFDGHLPVMHPPLNDVAPRFDHLEPAQILDGFVSALNCLVNGVFDGSCRGTGEFYEFVDGIFHI